MLVFFFLILRRRVVQQRVNFFEAAKIFHLKFIPDLFKLSLELLLGFLGQSQILATHNPVLKQDLLVLSVHHLPFLRQPEQSNRVSDQFPFDLRIEWRVAGETGTVVYFEQVGLALVVQHYVEAENLEEHRILEVVPLELLVGVRQIGLA